MRTALNVVENPLNASLEAVLPGVHRQFQTIESSLTVLGNKLDQAIAESARDVKQSVRESVPQIAQHIKKELAQQLIHFASHLSDSPLDAFAAGSITAHAPANLPGTTTRTTTTVDGSDVGELFALANGHHMTNPVRSILVLFREFNGIGEYEGIPIVGGIKKCEEMFKNKWRKNYTAAEAKFFSRILTVMKYVETKTGEGGAQERVLDELETVFKEDCRGKLANLEKYLKDKGMVSVKNRRGRASGSGNDVPTN